METMNNNQCQNPTNGSDLYIRMIGEIKRQRRYIIIIRNCLRMFWVLLFAGCVMNRYILRGMATDSHVNTINDITNIILFSMISLILIITIINYAFMKPRILID
jgi:hypothetical protein